MAPASSRSVAQRIYEQRGAGGMKAVVYEGRGDFRLEDRPVPGVVDPGDAVVRVSLSAICTSDLHIRAGAVPRAVPGTVVGHEFVGTVVETGPGVRNLKAGDRVAVNCETYCGECWFCSRGWVNNCTDPAGGWALGCRIDGGQAEYVRVPFADNGLVRIPDGVTDEQAVLMGDLLSTGYWAVDIGGISEGDTVAVIGAGPTGLCCAMMARLRNPKSIVVIDRDASRLDFAREHGIGDVFVDSESEDPAELLRGMTDGRGADVVLEVAGGRDTFRMAWTIARPNAVVVVVAMYEEDQVLPLPEMYGKNLTFKTGGVDGSHCGDVMRLISEGRIDASCLVTQVFPLSEAMEAYRLFASKGPGVMKVALRM